MGVELGGGEALNMEQTFSAFSMRTLVLQYGGWGVGEGMTERKGKAAFKSSLCAVVIIRGLSRFTHPTHPSPYQSNLAKARL